MNGVSKLQEVKNRIEQACARGNRNVSDVHLIAVTKYLNTDQTRHVLKWGMEHVGESRVQHAIPKIDALQENPVTWHFIGSLQKNKAKELPGKFMYLHSLDRYSLALELNKQFQKNKGTLRCFIQVNVSGEKSKHGIFPFELKEFLSEVSTLSSLEILGLMTMAPAGASREEVRSIFRGLKKLQTQMQVHHPSLTQLSMGMSQDYEIAIEEGATWIRLGTALFGG